jgi:hypothetical protein
LVLYRRGFNVPGSSWLYTAAIAGLLLAVMSLATDASLFIFFALNVGSLLMVFGLSRFQQDLEKAMPVGSLKYREEGGKTIYTLELDTYPENLQAAKYVYFRVDKN